MRLTEVERSIEGWIAFFHRAWQMGIRKLHSSVEYEGFPVLREVIGHLRKRRSEVAFRHIVKLAEPHFDTPDFEADRFRAKIEAYRSAFAIDHVDDVQWMWRHGLQGDEARIARFRGSAAQISEAVAELKQSGTIGRLLCFPYTTSFAKAAIMEDWIEGLVVYRNAQETAYDAVIDQAASLGKPSIIIRPFNAGQVFRGEWADASELLATALAKPSIEAAVLSTSNVEHLASLVKMPAT